MKKGKVPKDINPAEADSGQEEEAEPAKPAKGMKSAADAERLKLQIETLMQMRNATNERFSRLDEKMGELRAMVAQSDKEIIAVKSSAAKAVDMVNETRPDKLLAELQKRDAKSQVLESRIEAVSGVSEQIMKELKELKLRVKSFSGLDEIQKMSKDTTKDLAAMKAVQARIDVDSSKVEKIFIDVQKKYAEVEKLKAVADSLGKSFADMVKEVNGMKVKLAGLPEKGQLELMKKGLEEKSSLLSGLNKEDIRRMSEFVSIAKSVDSRIKAQDDKINETVDVVELVSEKVSALQKRPSSSPEPKFASIDLSKTEARLMKAERDGSLLKQKVDEMEDRLGKLSDSMESVPGSAPVADPEEAKALADKLSGLEEKIIRLESKAPESPKEAPADDSKMAGMSQQMAGVIEKLGQMGEDTRKLSDYYMGAMKHLDVRMNSLERMVYEEKGLVIGNAPGARSEAPPAQRPRSPAPAPQVDVQRIPSARVAPPAPPSQAQYIDYERPVAARPLPARRVSNELDDLEILKEHIMESVQKNESREKIMRDLMNAGYDHDLVARALSQAGPL